MTQSPKNTPVDLNPQPHQAQSGDVVYTVRPEFISREKLITGAVIFGVVCLFLATLVIMQATWMARGKVFLVELTLITSLVCFAIAILHRTLMENLVLLEQFADVVRDETSLQLQAAQLKIAELNERLVEKKPADDSSVVPDFLKSLAPLAMMFISKEKNFFRWSVFGFKVAKNAFDMWKEQERKSS